MGAQSADPQIHQCALVDLAMDNIQLATVEFHSIAHCLLTIADLTFICFPRNKK